MKQLPHYLFTRPGDKSDLIGKLTGTMDGSAVREVSLVFRTTDHAHADSMYDSLLNIMREEGWTVTLVEE